MLGLQGLWRMLPFLTSYMDAGNPESGPHAYTEGISLTDPFSYNPDCVCVCFRLLMPLHSTKFFQQEILQASLN